MNSKTVDAMTPYLITIKLSDDLAEAYKLLKEKGIRHLPVINSFDDVVGIISDRDFQRAMKPDLNGAVNFEPYALVSDYMNSPIKTVSYKVELFDVVQKMINEKLTALLVTQDNSLVGIITYEDLLKVLADLINPKKEESVMTTVQTWLYKTPIGEIARNFAVAGI